MSEQLTCFHCGAKLTEDTMHELDDHLMCDDCFEELTTFCDCCLDRIWRTEAEGNRVLTLCHYCYENNYTNCSNCGFLIHNDAAHYSNTPYGFCREMPAFDPDDIIPIQMFSERFRFGDFQIFKLPLVNLSHSVVS